MSCAEDKAGSNRGANHLVGHFGAHKVVESLSGAMAGYQIVRIDLLEGCDDLPNVLVGQWRHDVESTDNRMHLLDARSGLCLFDRIDDTTVTAGCQNDQPLAFDNEVRTDLMLKIIGNKLSVFFAADTFSGKHPKPLMIPTFSRLGRSGFSKPVCAILPVVKA